eukprot:4036726-Pyramimonas_sp.AAC.1
MEYNNGVSSSTPARLAYGLRPRIFSVGGVLLVAHGEYSQSVAFCWSPTRAPSRTLCSDASHSHTLPRLSSIARS